MWCSVVGLIALIPGGEMSRPQLHTSDSLCLGHSRRAGQCRSRSAEDAAAQLWVPATGALNSTVTDSSSFSDPNARGWLEVNTPEQRGARTRAALGQPTDDAANSLAVYVAFVRSQPRTASRWADLCVWHIYHRPGGIHMRVGDAAIGSVSAALSALRVSAELETDTRRRPVEAANVAVDLAEQVIVDGFGNTPEPLLAEELLNMAMAMQRGSGT
jgi:hypothetical protein